jgi:hypothetical protein
MSCKSYLSEHQSNLTAEVAIHFPGLKGLDKPIVWVYPKLLVCMNCGFTEFAIPSGAGSSPAAECSAHQRRAPGE